MEPTKQPPTTENVELKSIVSDVLAELAFMIGDDEDIDITSVTDWMHVEITYSGVASGRLRCWCTRPFAVRLAANLLGTEVDETEAQLAAEDAVREFANVLCGQIVTIWHGTSSAFALTIPGVSECWEAPSLDEDKPGYRCLFSAEGEPLLCVHDQGP